MKQDILSDLGYLALGSRLKRLSDRMLADAALVHQQSDEPVQPGQFPLIAALDRYGGLSVNRAAEVLGVSQPAITRAANELIKANLVSSAAGEKDKRQRDLALTDEGVACVARLKRKMWPRVEAAAVEAFSGLSGDFLDQIAEIESRLAVRSIYQRVSANTLEVLPYDQSLARHFHDINAEWVEDMFVLEDHDRHVLSNPEPYIIDKGGDILFVKSEEHGVVGACALMPDEHGFTELTKMGVRSSVRGQKAGAFLLRAVLERARELGFDQKLYLVTNTKCEAAIHLYEKNGFRHCDEIMELFGGRYERCDVAMRYRAS